MSPLTDLEKTLIVLVVIAITLFIAWLKYR